MAYVTTQALFRHLTLETLLTKTLPSYARLYPVSASGFDSPQVSQLRQEIDRRLALDMDMTQTGIERPTPDFVRRTR